MIGTLLGLAALAAAVVAFAKRDRIEAALKRFDQANLAKRRHFADAMRTPGAHMNLTVEEMDARTEPVETVWAPPPGGGPLRKRFLWRGETFETEEEAKAARAQAVFDAARGFYADLDRQYRSLR